MIYTADFHPHCITHSVDYLREDAQILIHSNLPRSLVLLGRALYADRRIFLQRVKCPTIAEAMCRPITGKAFDDPCA